MADQTLLVIADISGYTRYMRLHRMALAHSQVVTGRLLEAVVHAVPSLRLVEVEGDAAFLYEAIGERDVVPSVAELALTMHGAFHREQERMITLNMCSCPGCVEAGKLRVKFVAHVGEAAMQRIKRRQQLIGVDVITVHRMLKNSVPVDEYVLMSELLYQNCAPELRERAVGVEEDLEGIGATQLYFLNLEDLALQLPDPPTATVPRRLRETMGVVLRGMPRMLGKQREHEVVDG